MMKSKICKAKRKDNKEWVEGFYFCMVHDDKRHEHHFIIPVGADLSKGTPIEKIQVEIAIETLVGYNEWISCNKRLPEDYERMKVWVTIDCIGIRRTKIAHWNGYDFEFENGMYIPQKNVLAWKPYRAPAPWRGEPDAKEK